tara:strand:- start:75 stop:644 length:570 start_codon:yes stop_codon:yes gene_type:complete
MIFESIITSIDSLGRTNVAPFGIKREHDFIFISPYIPSKTFDNLKLNKVGAVNYVDDSEIFVNCIIGKKEFSLKRCTKVACFYLEKALTVEEFLVDDFLSHKLRPTFKCKILKTNKVKAFMGHNRSRSAIIEACILASRIKILEEKKIFDELNYLSIAISKTSGKKELILWKELNKFIRKELKLKKKYD